MSSSSSKNKKKNGSEDQSSDDVKKIYVSPYYFEGTQFYPGPKYVYTPKHQKCPGGIKIEWKELLLLLVMEGIKKAPCPQCNKRINYSNLIESIAPDYKSCYCGKLCMIKKAKNTGKLYASCMIRMGRKERCDYFSYF